MSIASKHLKVMCLAMGARIRRRRTAWRSLYSTDTERQSPTPRNEEWFSERRKRLQATSTTEPRRIPGGRARDTAGITGPRPEGQHHALYRFFDVEGKLLYVGISANLPQRLSTHACEKPWWHDVVQVTVEHFSNSSDALTAEKFAIMNEQPLYGCNYNWRRRQ